MPLEYFCKMVTHTLLGFYPFSLYFTHPSTAPVGRKVGGFILMCACVEIWRLVSIWSPLLGGYDLHVDGFSFFALGSTWCHFYTFASMYLHLSSLVCSARLHLILRFVVPITYVSYYFFVLFVTPKTGFIQLQVSISLTDELFIAVRSPVPCLLPSPACTPLHILCPHFSRPLLLHQPCISLHCILVLVIHLPFYVE